MCRPCCCPSWHPPATCMVSLISGCRLIRPPAFCISWPAPTMLSAPGSTAICSTQHCAQLAHPHLRLPFPSPLAVVRDLPDLQRVALLFSQRLLGLSPSPLHASSGRRPSSARGGGSNEPLTPADLAVDVSAALFRGRHTPQLAALQRLLPADTQDMRLLFFRVRAASVQLLFWLTGNTYKLSPLLLWMRGVQLCSRAAVGTQDGADAQHMLPASLPVGLRRGAPNRAGPHP